MWWEWLLAIICAVLLALIVINLWTAGRLFEEMKEQLAATAPAAPAESKVDWAGWLTPAPPPEKETPSRSGPPAHEAQAAPSPSPPAPEPLRENNLPVAPYVASLKGTRFHSCDCIWAARIQEEHRQYYHDRDSAQAAGFEPCGVCSP